MQLGRQLYATLAILGKGNRIQGKGYLCCHQQHQESHLAVHRRSPTILQLSVTSDLTEGPSIIAN
jgi:hypothetical protein